MLTQVPFSCLTFLLVDKYISLLRAAAGKDLGTDSWIWTQVVGYALLPRCTNTTTLYLKKHQYYRLFTYLLYKTCANGVFRCQQAISVAFSWLTSLLVDKYNSMVTRYRTLGIAARWGAAHGAWASSWWILRHYIQKMGILRELTKSPNWHIIREIWAHNNIWLTNYYGIL